MVAHLSIKKRKGVLILQKKMSGCSPSQKIEEGDANLYRKKERVLVFTEKNVPK